MQALNDLHNSFDEAVIRGKGSIKQAKKRARFNDQSSLTPIQVVTSVKEDVLLSQDQTDFPVESHRVLDDFDLFSEEIEIFDTYSLNENFDMKG